MICSRLATGTATLGLFGLAQAYAHLPPGLSWGTWAASWGWAIALFACAGVVLGAGVGLLSWAVGRAFTLQRRIMATAATETVLVVPVFAWLLLNEITYHTTSEVLGYETLAMVWANPAATFEVAWEMASQYLLLVIAGTLAVAAVVFTLSRWSLRRLNQSPARASSAAIPIRWSSPRITGSMTALLTAVAVLLVWQIRTQPSEALTTVCRSAPPLRALNLPRVIIGVDLNRPLLLEPGAPLMTEQQYQTAMGFPRSPAPNVVLIVLESVPAKALHCYGHARADITPNLDRLAEGGTLFEHCLAAGPFSSYGVASVLTSLYMLRAETNDHFADTSFPFLALPKALKLADYQLALFSSGNEAFDNLNRFNPPEDNDVYFSLDTADVPKPDCMRLSDHHAVERFETWMAARRDPRPFYCGFYLQSTHFNYEVPEPWASHYGPVPPPFDNGDAIIRIPPDVLPLLRNQYDNAMRYSDYWIGRIRSALDGAGALDNTILVVVGDHGEAFMEHGLARHGVHVWEEMIHIPLIVHVGADLRGRLERPLPARVAGTVSGIDLAPTVASLVGIQPHPSWQGLDVLDPGYTGVDRPVFSILQLTRWQEALVINRLKYVYDLTDMKAMLFDLANDPGEKVDLTASHPELTTAMHELLGEWHSGQLQYYAKSPPSCYLGRFQPEPSVIKRIGVAAIRLRNTAAEAQATRCRSDDEQRGRELSSR